MNRISGTRRVWLIACNEWSEALRSRRALVVILLYLAAALLSMNGFLSVLLRLENELAATLLLPEADHPGAVINALWRSDTFRNMVSGAVQSESLVRDLVGQSPIVLVYAGLTFFYTPLLVALVAPVRIAEELANGSVRYIAVRTSRVSWTLGKFIGQAMLFAVALLSSALAAWALSRYRMIGAEGWPIALGMLGWSLRVWVYGVAFLGLLMGLAHLSRSPGRCTAISLMALFGLSVLAWALTTFDGDGVRSLFPALYQLLPQAYRLDLWRSSLSFVAPAVVTLLALGSTYLLAGYAWFRRSDL